MNAQPLEGRTAIVTGSAQGIGKAIVKRFVDEGARVAIVDVDMDQAQKAAKEHAPPDYRRRSHARGCYSRFRSISSPSSPLPWFNYNWWD